MYMSRMNDNGMHQLTALTRSLILIRKIFTTVLGFWLQTAGVWTQLFPCIYKTVKHRKEIGLNLTYLLTL